MKHLSTQLRKWLLEGKDFATEMAVLAINNRETLYRMSKKTRLSNRDLGELLIICYYLRAHGNEAIQNLANLIIDETQGPKQRKKE